MTFLILHIVQHAFIIHSTVIISFSTSEPGCQHYRCVVFKLYNYVFLGNQLEGRSSFLLILLVGGRVMKLGDSRSHSSKEPMKSTKGSFFLKATGRESQPIWSNRFVKDFNDLDYLTDNHRFPNMDKFRNTEKLRKQQMQAGIRNTRKTTTRSKTRWANGKSLSLNISLHRPGRLDCRTISNPEDLKYGLSPFEYVNTIEGKLEGRSSHHLSFDKHKIQRTNNEYPIHYDRHQDLDFSYIQQMSERQALGKYHKFGSYPSRKVFEPKRELDKFYDEDHSRRLASPRRSREAVMKFQKITGRKDPKYNQSVSLAFDTVPCIQKVQKRPQSYSIPHSPRDIVFGPQVIDEKRGCYR